MPDIYEIIAGERRWRAAQRAGLHDVPVLVLEVDDREALELAIIENVQRTDLNPLEEALGYQSLADEFDHTQDDIARIVGKSRSHVANTLRLLRLPDNVKAYMADGKLSAGHARALISNRTPKPSPSRDRRERPQCRQVEAIAQDRAGTAAAGGPPALRGWTRMPTRVALEKRLADALGLLVEHAPSRRGRRAADPLP